MIENTSGTDKKLLLGGLISILAGLWGIVITLIFTFSQIRMISPRTPVSVVLQSQSLGFLYLALHLVIFAFLTITAYSAIRMRPGRNIWSKVFIPVSIVLIGLSLIPGSTIGIFILPAAVGLLVGGVFLRTSEIRYQQKN